MSRTTHGVSNFLINYNIIRNRELGLRNKIGDEDEISRMIYYNMKGTGSSVPSGKDSTDQGGIFNLEFSLDG